MERVIIGTPQENKNAKEKLQRIHDREPKGDQKKTLGIILEQGQLIERKDGKAYWCNYLKEYERHTYDRK